MSEEVNGSWERESLRRLPPLHHIQLHLRPPARFFCSLNALLLQEVSLSVAQSSSSEFSTSHLLSPLLVRRRLYAVSKQLSRPALTVRSWPYVPRGLRAGESVVLDDTPFLPLLLTTLLRSLSILSTFGRRQASTRAEKGVWLRRKGVRRNRTTCKDSLRPTLLDAHCTGPSAR